MVDSSHCWLPRDRHRSRWYVCPPPHPRQDICRRWHSHPKHQGNNTAWAAETRRRWAVGEVGEADEEVGAEAVGAGGEVGWVVIAPEAEDHEEAEPAPGGEVVAAADEEVGAETAGVC